MGGDGGTISSNRTYLRGAGKACHTADHPSNALRRARLEDAERARSALGTCAASGTALDLSPARKNGGGGGGSGGETGGSVVSAADIVACPYGKLYRRETVLEALLRRSQTGGGKGVDATPGWHVRGMKDLHPVRFHVVPSSSPEKGGTTDNHGNGNGAATAGNGKRYVAACPITGSEIGSGNVPSFVIVRSKSKDGKKNGGDENDEVSHNPNVLSERAIKEMGIRGLQAEYGPFEERDMIRLAPPETGGVFEKIQRGWDERMEEEQAAKLKKKKDKKRKRGVEAEKPGTITSLPAPHKKSEIKSREGGNDNIINGGRGDGRKKSAADEARFVVRSAVAHNPVLSNLFGTGKKKGQRSEKERKEDLFTRNC